MVKYQEQQLDRMFAALSDATRRGLLAQLERRGGVSVSDLAAPFDMTLPAVVKHLDVLAEAGLITRSKAGRTVTCELNAQPMEAAMQWLDRYQRFWTGALDRLTAFAEKEEAGRRKPAGSFVVATDGKPAPKPGGRRKRKGRS
jgi:DNA-binding transcriptional ArsR family regulator